MAKIWWRLSPSRTVPRGAARSLMPPPVKELAVQHGIPVYQPHKVRDPAFIEMIRELKPDVIVVVAFGQILPKALLDIPPQGCINVHASLLPRYRGAAPLNWCIINGETETGVTTMLMDLGLDTGPMLLVRKTALDENEDIVSLHDRMAAMGAELLAETLDRLAAGDIVPQQQNNADSCYAAMLKKEDGLINWHDDARTIHNQVRGLAVWPGACTLHRRSDPENLPHPGRRRMRRAGDGAAGGKGTAWKWPAGSGSLFIA